MPFYESLRHMEKSTAWEVLVAFPRYAYLIDEADRPVLDELDAILRVERRQPGVTDMIKAAIAAKGA